MFDVAHVMSVYLQFVVKQFSKKITAHVLALDASNARRWSSTDNLFVEKTQSKNTRST